MVAAICLACIFCSGMLKQQPSRDLVGEHKVMVAYSGVFAPFGCRMLPSGLAH